MSGSHSWFRFTRSYLPFAAAAMALSCSDGTGPGRAPASFTLESSRAVTQSIGIEGGTITARSSSGIEYRLTVPPGALPTATAITMTPIGSGEHYPTSGGFAGGVDFAPDGLRFAQVARLEMTLPAPPAGMRAIVAGYEGDPSELQLLMSASTGARIEIPVVHFSGVTAGFGTTADLQAFPNPAPTSQSQHFIAALGQVQGSTTLTDPEKDAAYVQLLVAWITSVIQPLIAAANTDAELIRALGELDTWRLAIGLYNATGSVGADLAATQDMAAVKILAAVDGNADLCGAQQSLAALYNVGFWYLQAVHHGVATATHALSPTDAEKSIRTRCLTVELESDTLASPMIVGTPYTLSTVWGVRFKGQAQTQGMPLKVGHLEVTPNVTFAPAIGLSDISGLAQTVATASAVGPVRLVTAACLMLPGITPPPPALGCGDIVVGIAVVLDRVAESPVKVTVTPSTANLAAGATQQFSASVTGASNTNVTWTAAGGTITQNGLYTAGTSAGTFTVRATSVEEPTVSATAQVTIGSPPSGSLNGTWLVEIGAGATCIAFQGTASVGGSLGGPLSAALDVRGASGARAAGCTMGPSNTAEGTLQAQSTGPVTWSASWAFTTFNGQVWDNFGPPINGNLAISCVSTDFDGNGSGNWWFAIHSTSSDGGPFQFVGMRRDSGVPLSQPRPPQC